MVALLLLSIIENHTNNKLLQWSNSVHNDYLNNGDQLKQFYKTLRILSPFTESKLQDSNNNFIYNIFDKLDYLYDYTKDLYTTNNTMPKELQNYYQSKTIFIENDIKNDNCNTHDTRCFNFINSQNILKCLKKKKNINSDDILSYKQLTSIHKKSPDILYSVLYYIGKYGFIPTYIKYNYTVFIPKPGKKNYQPIKQRSITQSHYMYSLALGCANIVLNQLILSKLPPFQIGGRPKRNADEHVCNIQFLIEYHKLKKRPLLIIGTDASKAFDKLVSEYLIFRWRYIYLIGGELLNFLIKILDNHYTRIKSGKLYTGAFKTKISSPQGGEISTISYGCNAAAVNEDLAALQIGVELSDYKSEDIDFLFEYEYIIKDNELDIIKIIFNELSYIDDIYLFANSFSDLRIILLQFDTSNTFTGITMNGDKCMLAITNIKYFSEKDKSFIKKYYSDNTFINSTDPNEGLFINGTRLKRTYEMKILGIIMSFTKTGNFHFNEHVKIKIDKSDKQLSALLINGLNYQITNLSMRTLIYSSIIQSNTIYGSRSIFFSRTNLNSLQSFQNRAIKKLFAFFKNVNNKIIRVSLNIPPITAITRIQFLNQFFHITNTCKNMKTSTYFIFKNLFNITID